MTPRQLSRELREGDSDDLQRRRWVAGLSFVGVGIGVVVSLYQFGIIKHLPDPPVGPFDSDRVDASDYAYKRMLTPDAFMMVATYGVTAALAGAGGETRAETHPWLPLAMAGKAAYDLATCVKLGAEEWAENKAFCAYCQVATLISAATAALTLPEAWRALKRLEQSGPPQARVAQALRRSSDSSPPRRRIGTSGRRWGRS